VGRVMLSAFFNINGLLVLAFMDPDITINTQRYCGNPLRPLYHHKEKAFHYAHEGCHSLCFMTMTVPMFPILSRTCCTLCTGRCWIITPYSLDLSLCDFHVFAPLK
jgi:hypothetical protein